MKKWVEYKKKATSEGRLIAYDFKIDWDYYFKVIKPITDKWFVTTKSNKE